MKITLELHGRTHSVDTGHDHASVDEVVDIFRGLLLSAGFQPESVDEYIYLDSCTPENNTEHINRRVE